MKCRKCKKQIPDESKFCNLCGAPQKENKMYRRPDGLYEKVKKIDGRRVSFYGKTEKEVFDKMMAYVPPSEIGVSFREAADAWEAEHYPTVAYNTSKSYSPACKRAVAHFGAAPLKQITPSDIDAFIKAMARKGYAQKTIKTHLLVINLIFSKAIVDGKVETNPAEYVRIPKNLKRAPRPFPPDEHIEIIKANIDSQMGLFALFVLYTGCRRGEALAMQYKDIDRQNKTISVTKSVYHENNQPKIKQPKTEAGKREIILFDALADILPTGQPDDYLFLDENGGLYTNSNFGRRWNEYCLSIGLADKKIYPDKSGGKHEKILPLITPHQLRHAFATILFDAGVDPKDAQGLLGHTNISVTMDTYTHIRSMRRPLVAQKVNEFVNNS